MKVKTHHITLLLLALLFSCKQPQKKEQLTTKVTAKEPTSSIVVSHKVVNQENVDSLFTEENYQDYFIVIADTGVNYYKMRDDMLKISEKSALKIDTLNRTFYPEKNLIALAEDDEDEMYAGDYFPRRIPGESLSLEYLNIYKTGAGERTIALVSGIYENKKSADSALSLLKTKAPNAFSLLANMYTGCLH